MMEYIQGFYLLISLVAQAMEDIMVQRYDNDWLANSTLTVYDTVM